MPRLGLTVGLAILLTLATASAVFAARPDRTAASGFGSFVIPADLGCGFDVLYEEQAFNQVITTWTRRDGSTVVHVTGRYQITLTNMETGASIRASIAGPTFVRVSPDGAVTVTGTGSWGLWTPGEHIYLANGHMDPSRSTVAESLSTLRGHAIDVCAELAS